MFSYDFYDFAPYMLYWHWDTFFTGLSVSRFTLHSNLQSWGL